MDTHPLLDPALRPVIGHRGAAARAPENTLESFRQALAAGADALEFDVRASADRRIVVMHDPTVDRTTDRTGAVSAMTLSELQRVDAGARFTTDTGRTRPYAGRGITVPSLDQVLEEFPRVPLLIEIKTGGAADGTRAVIERHEARERCIVASFDDSVLAPFRGGGFKVSSTQRDVVRLLIPAQLGLAIQRPRFDTMCIPRTFRGLPLPVGALARALGRLGILVHVWTVDSPATARDLWRVGVRGIITNDPAVMIAERKKG
jgi:glycerophosphoryl diester phosphodiesterase